MGTKITVLLTLIKFCQNCFNTLSIDIIQEKCKNAIYYFLQQEFKFPRTRKWSIWGTLIHFFLSLNKLLSGRKIYSYDTSAVILSSNISAAAVILLDCFWFLSGKESNFLFE